MKTSTQISNSESDVLVQHSTLKRENKPAFFSQKDSGEMFFGPATLQPKLEIGSPDDAYEREADRVADQVMKMPDPAIQKFDEDEEIQMKRETGIQMKCNACEHEELLQRKPMVQLKADNNQAASSELSQKIHSKKGSGHSLPNKTQQEMGTKLGADFSRVRVHTGSNAIQLNRELGARALTVGNDIFINKGQYNPNSGEGKRLMAHELVHTVQHKKSLNSHIIQKQENALNDESRDLDEPILPTQSHLFGQSGWPTGHIATLFFRTGSDVVDDPSILDIIANRYKFVHRADFFMLGYTDKRKFRNEARTNEQLSLERAESVTNKLNSAFSSVDNLDTLDYEVFPVGAGVIGTTRDEYELASARRTEIFVYNVEEPSPVLTNEEIRDRIEGARENATEDQRDKADKAKEIDKEANRSSWWQRGPIDRLETESVPRVTQQILELMENTDDINWSYYSGYNVRYRKRRFYEFVHTDGNKIEDFDREILFASDENAGPRDFFTDVIDEFRNQSNIDNDVERLVTAIRVNEMALRVGFSDSRNWIRDYPRFHTMHRRYPNHELLQLNTELDQWMTSDNNIYNAASL
ncbi:MAG: DUF4157 domain-containing protein [Balneolaceae bacterium]|nr:DUF4157 domain-containing protein [Balneolaceae bacterium]